MVQGWLALGLTGLSWLRVNLVWVDQIQGGGWAQKNSIEAWCPIPACNPVYRSWPRTPYHPVQTWGHMLGKETCQPNPQKMGFPDGRPSLHVYEVNVRRSPLCCHIHSSNAIKFQGLWWVGHAQASQVRDVKLQW